MLLNTFYMEYRYRINNSDKKEVLDKIGEKAKVSLLEKKKEDKNLPFLLLPLRKEKELIIASSFPLFASIFKESNDQRMNVINKLAKAEEERKKAHLYALLATFLVIALLASAFFAIGFGMKRNAGYYALLLLTLGFGYLTYLTLKKGAGLYASYREKKRLAYALLEDKTVKQ